MCCGSRPSFCCQSCKLEASFVHCAPLVVASACRKSRMAQASSPTASQGVAADVLQKIAYFCTFFDRLSLKKRVYGFAESVFDGKFPWNRLHPGKIWDQFPTRRSMCLPLEKLWKPKLRVCSSHRPVPANEGHHCSSPDQPAVRALANSLFVLS